MASNAASGHDSPGATPDAVAVRAPRYAYYALFLLILANFFNYVDRHIVGILAQPMQRDLGLTDTQLGFLLGTAFATLYGVLGIAMGRIADQLSRTRLMTVGLTLWSAMTAASGAAMGFASIAVARIGVGVGEAAANPCSHSLLSDYFPARQRGAVLGAYLASVHLGIGASMIIGGLIVQRWSSICTVLPGGACGIAEWRAAFMIVGLPGLLLAVLIAMLREPARPAAFSAGAAKPSALAIVVREVSTSVPPFTLFNLYTAGGSRAVWLNLLMAAAIVAVAGGLSVATGDWAQWIALGIGFYSVATWAHVLRHRDPAFFRLTFGDKTFLYSTFSGAAVTCFSGTVMTWAIPYAMRTLSTNAATVGLALGLVSVCSAGLSVVVGGFVADRWKRRDKRAPIWIAMIALLVPIPLLFAMMNAQTLSVYVICYAVFIFFAMSWAGAYAALVQDLVIERMRGAAAAIFSLIMMLTAAGLGPYWTGKISTMTGSLATGIYALMIFVPIAFVLLWLAAARLRAETPERRRAMAEAAGEVF